MLNERTVVYLVSASGNRAGAALLREQARREESFFRDLKAAVS